MEAPPQYTEALQAHQRYRLAQTARRKLSLMNEQGDYNLGQLLACHTLLHNLERQKFAVVPRRRPELNSKTYEQSVINVTAVEVSEDDD